MKGFIDSIKNEIKRIYSDKKTFIIMLIAPSILTLLFGYLYTGHTVANIKTAVIDNDNTSLSRTIIDGFNSSNKFLITTYLDDEAKVKDLFNKGEIDAAIVLPQNFMKDVIDKKSSKVLVLVNGSNMIISNTVMSYSTEIIQTYSIGTSIKFAEAGGTFPKNVQSVIMPMNMSARIWYNPTFNYCTFLLPGLIGVIVQQICFLYATSAAVVNRNTTLQGEVKFRDVITKITGIVFVQFTVNLVNFFICLEIAINVFGIPMKGSLVLLLLLGTVFILNIISFGILLSTICRSELEASQLSMFVAVPSFLISGFTWPYFMMPLPIKILSRLMPLTYFVNPIRKIFNMGAGIEYVWSEILVLFAIVIVCLPLSTFVYYIKAKKLNGESINNSQNMKIITL